MKFPSITQLDAQLEPILRAMEGRGILLDVDHLLQLATRLTAEITELESAIYQSVGHEFTIDSPRQLAAVLYDELHLADGDLFIRTNKSGKSTAASELDKLTNAHPIVPLVLAYREKTKLLSTYVEPLPKLVDKAGRLHTTYSIDTAAGRLSSKHPNLQNIPVRTNEGKEIRRAFIAPEGMALLSVDYSQIDLRVAAHLSGDPGLMAAFTDQADIHAATAASMNVDRRTAKAINFGVLYGQGAFGLSEALGISREEAQAFIDRYFTTFPKLREWIESVQQSAKDTGYAETLLGRRRYLKVELVSRNAALRAFAERVAINHPVQGTSAELMALAMIEINRMIPESAARLLLQVHDELLFEIPLQKATVPLDLVKRIQSIMTSVIKLRVPIVTEAKHGPNWRDMESIEV